MNYDDLLIEADKMNLIVKEKNLKSNAKGLIKGNKIILSKNIDTHVEKACILAEELAHRDLTVGNILDLTKTENRKQEYKARKLSSDKMIGLIGIIRAYEAGCTSLYDIAEFLDVTEKFLADTLSCYKSNYGVFTMLDHYIIYFEPNLGVMKMI